MFLRNLQAYADTASDSTEIGVAIFSIETGDKIAVTYDVVIDINEYGELIINIAL